MPHKCLDWLDDMDIGGLLEDEGDVKLIYQYCGRDTLKTPWENFLSMNLYISAKPLMKIKKSYIRANCNGTNIKALAVLLDVSERFVYEVLESGTGANNDGKSLLSQR